MNKVYHSLFTAAVLIAALCFSACSSNDAEDPGSSYKEGDVILTYNESVFKFNQYGEGLAPKYMPKIEDGAEFVIACPFDFDITTFSISFPRKVYGELPSSSFKVGDTLDTKQVNLLFYNAQSGVMIGQCVAGTAKVVANDGKHISVAFDNFKVISTEKVLNFVKGTIKYTITDDY